MTPYNKERLLMHFINLVVWIGLAIGQLVKAFTEEYFKYKLSSLSICVMFIILYLLFRYLIQFLYRKETL